MRALLKTGEDVGAPLDVLQSVESVNDRQKLKLLEKVCGAFNGELAGKQVAVWGLAFKAETDDMRESPAIPLVEGLLNAGASVRAYDPAATANAKKIFGDRIEYGPSEYEVLKDADVLVIVTEWLAFRNPDFGRMKELMRQHVVVDGRNLYKPTKLRNLGFTYVAFGRP